MFMKFRSSMEWRGFKEEGGRHMSEWTKVLRWFCGNESSRTNPSRTAFGIALDLWRRAATRGQHES